MRIAFFPSQEKLFDQISQSQENDQPISLKIYS